MSRARDLASSGVTSTVLSAKAPLASPDFTGTVDLTGTTISLDNDQISGDKVSGGTIGAGTFDGTIGTSASGFGLITGADQYRLLTDFTGTGYFSGSNIERNDTVFEKIGTGVSYDSSSGIFSFPNTGIWWVIAGGFYDSLSGAQGYIGITIDVSTSGTSGTFHSRAFSYESLYGSSTNGSSFSSLFLDVSDTSNVVLKFYRNPSDNTNVRVRGNTGFNETHFTFLRLGDT